MCKNFLDIFQSAMTDKYAGLLCNSGGIRSYNFGAGELMMSMAFHNNVTLIQPVVHSWWEDFSQKKLVSKKVIEKLDLLIDRLQEV